MALLTQTRPAKEGHRLNKGGPRTTGSICLLYLSSPSHTHASLILYIIHFIILIFIFVLRQWHICGLVWVIHDFPGKYLGHSIRRKLIYFSEICIGLSQTQLTYIHTFIFLSSIIFLLFNNLCILQFLPFNINFIQKRKKQITEKLVEHPMNSLYIISDEFYS